MTETPILESIMEEQNIRGVTFNFQDGPVPGYQWRLRLTIPPTENQPKRTEWTRWVFGSTLSVDQMLSQWRNFLAKQNASAKSETPYEVKLVDSHRIEGRALQVKGKDEIVADLYFYSHSRGRETDTSPHYRLPIRELRALHQSLGDSIAKIESGDTNLSTQELPH